MEMGRDASFLGLEPLLVDGGPAGPNGPSDLTIAGMADLFGVTPRALRFYEAKGLVSPRRQGTARLYGPAERERLALVLRAKRLGFTLGEIRQMLDASDAPGETAALAISRRQCFEQIKLLEARKREIESALAELRRTYSSFYARLLHEAEPTGERPTGRA